MLVTLFNIVIPVFAVVAVGVVVGRRQANRPLSNGPPSSRTPSSRPPSNRPPSNTDMSFVNLANVQVFCPALVFSALMAHPVTLGESWLLMVAGVLLMIVPGAMLYAVRFKGLERRTLAMGGMFRNTGNIGIPLMMLAYGEDKMGAIIILFVLSNLMHFSLGLFMLSHSAGRWQWLKNPLVWAALLGLLLADHQAQVPDFVLSSSHLLGQISVPLMLFALGVRLSQGEIGHVGLALRVNVTYLCVGAVSFLAVAYLLPLSQDWLQLLALSVMLPPAVLNYLLCEQYQCQPNKMASIVLLGNLLSLVTIPAVIYLTLIFI